MKTLVIGLPEALPPELADNPDVIVIDPETLGEETLAELDAASGGMLMAEDGEEMPEGGEGPLEEWAGEEEKEHGMGGRAGEDEEDEKGGGADDEEKDPLGGEGDEEDEKEKKGGERGGRFGGRSGRGGTMPALSAWARAMGGRGRLEPVSGHVGPFFDDARTGDSRPGVRVFGVRRARLGG